MDGQSTINLAAWLMSNPLKHFVLVSRERDIVAPNLLTLDTYLKSQKRQDPRAQVSIAMELIETFSKMSIDEIEREGCVLVCQQTFGWAERVPISQYLVGNGNKQQMTALLVEVGVRWVKRLANTNIGMGKQPLAEAQYLLGTFYLLGSHGMSIDKSRAFGYFLQASKQNHAKATFEVGKCYEHGHGTKKNGSKAVRFYRKSAILGNPYSMHRLALVLLHGQLRQKKNVKVAVVWLKRAVHLVDNSYPYPIYDLAICYEKNWCPALIPDERYTHQLLLMAAKLGHPMSQYKLGLCYEHGLLGQAQDPGLSIRWHLEAAVGGCIDAELSMSGWCLVGYEDILPQDDNEAFNWALKPATKGCHRGAFAVGYYYENGIGCVPNIKTAHFWYKQSAKMGNKRAKERLRTIERDLGLRKSCKVM